MRSGETRKAAPTREADGPGDRSATWVVWGEHSQIRFCKRGSLNVRFAPKATEWLRCEKMTRWAMCGRLRVGKGFLHECSIGRCSHVFGLLARFA